MTKRDMMRLPHEETGYNRHSRWEMHEILRLVAAKVKQNEEIRDAGMRSRKFGSQDERWDLISSYCTAHGVDRNARECRRQWNNMFQGDYRRIRNWGKLVGVESFWTMSKEKRKEHQLPPMFHWEVFEEIETFLGRKPLSPLPSRTLQQDRADKPATGNDVSIPKTEEQQRHGHAVEHANSTPHSGLYAVENLSHGSNTCRRQNNKRKSSLVASTENLEEQLTTTVETRDSAVQAELADKIRQQVEVINYHSELDRCQRKEQGDRLINVVSQLAHSVGRIAEGLQRRFNKI